MNAQGRPAVVRQLNEFRVVDLTDPATLENRLNELGRQGFGLATPYPVALKGDDDPAGGHMVLILARPIGADVIGGGLIS